MENIIIQKTVSQLRVNTISRESCQANHCADCRFMEMDARCSDGIHRCAWRGEWLRPSTEACYKFTKESGR